MTFSCRRWVKTNLAIKKGYRAATRSDNYLKSEDRYRSTMKMGIMSLWRRGGDTKLRYCRLRFHSVHYCIECPPSPHHQHHPRTAPRLRTTALLRCRPSERLDAASQRPLVALRPRKSRLRSLRKIIYQPPESIST
ncbi:hypothetical protein J6590_072348 [Homalodisca vitripennis]|nr:hypothetical protein J6590_072348 [Homalodisca vitripennis]